MKAKISGILLLLVITAYDACGAKILFMPDGEIEKASSYKPIRYSLDTIGEILYVNKGGTISGLERPVTDGPYMGPIAVAASLDGFIVIYEFHNTTLYLFDKNCQLVKKKNVEYSLYDVWIDSLGVYAFDGTNVIEYNRKLEVLAKSKIGLPKDIRLLHNASFFWGRYLFVKEFNFTVRSSVFAYVYNRMNRKLSSKIAPSECFLPVTQCDECDYSLLNSLFFDRGRYRNFLGQSEKLLIGSITPKNDNEPYFFIVLNKHNGAVYRLDGFAEDAIIPGVRPFNFVNSSEALFLELKTMPNNEPQSLLVQKLSIIMQDCH